MSKIEKGPKCRQANESEAECVSRKVSELIDEGYEQAQAVAIAKEMCAVSCSDVKCLVDFVQKRTLTKKDLTPPAGVRKACAVGIGLYEDGYGGSGLEAATIREARSIARGKAITVAKAGKLIRFWGRNSRFLDEPKDSPAWTSAQLWGGRPGKSWAGKLKRARDAED